MNRSIFLRLVWKEYRLQRALWIAMTMLTAMLLFLFHVFALNSTERFCWQLSAGLVLPALYCLGCGATLFAGEREAGTFEFQRSLPVAAKTVFAAKFLFAFVSAAAMFTLVGTALMMLNPGSEINPSEMLQRYAVAVGRRMPLLGLQFLLWSVLLSLLLRRVLVAAVLGVTVGSFNFEFVRGWYSRLWGSEWWVSPELVVMTVAVALADLWFGVRWFREKRERRGRAVPSVAGNGLAAWSDRFLRPSGMMIVSRLVWQHWRQTWRLAAVLVGATILPLAIIIIERLAASEFLRRPAFASRNGEGVINDPLIFFFGVVPAFVGVSLLGLIAFHPDQWGRGYGFLADRGAAPKFVWLSRQLVCWAMAAAALPALLVAALFIAPTLVDSGGSPIVRLVAPTCAAVIGYVILSVAAGQFCSMFFRSGILAGLFSIILTLALTGWCALMGLWQVSWLWSVLPIPIALLLATRLRTRDWLIERNTFRAWLRPGLALAVPALTLLIAVPLYRVYQIPLVDPGFSPDEFAREMTPEELAAYERYDRTAIAPSVLPLDKAAKYQQDGKLDEALEEYMAAIVIAGRCRGWYALEPEKHWGGYSANDIEKNVYRLMPSWAACPGQTPERILAARKRLEQLLADFSSNKEIKLGHLQMQQLLEGVPGAIDKVINPSNKRQRLLTMLWLSLPSERARGMRLLNIRTKHMLDVSSQADRTSASSERLFVSDNTPFYYQHISWRYRFFLVDDLLRENTLWGYQFIKDRAAIETERRAVRIILALEAWKLQHSSLPKTLDELVGSCLDQIPNDPYTGKPFLYFPEGSPNSFAWKQDSEHGEIATHKPFIWSAGPKIRPITYPPGKSNIPVIKQYAIKNNSDDTSWRKPATETEIWASGWAFPIP